MFKNDLKITFRKIKNQKVYSFINIVGLSIGITCFLFILLYVLYERSYDSYHPDPDYIFRVAMDFKSQSRESLEAMTYAPLAKAIKENYPSVKYAARIRQANDPLVRHEDKAFYETYQMFTDSDLFGIFSIPFIQGDPNTALDRPYTVVISQDIAEKYFGTTDILGKTLKIDGDGYEITGIVKNCPQNTHLKYQLIQSFESFEGARWTQSWSANMVYTYIKLHPNTNRDELEAQIRNISDRYSGERDKRLGYSKIFFLQRIKDIHLYSHLHEETEPPGNPLYVLIYSVVGILILVIACLNFINLSTALSTNRAREVGMRKVVGAKQGQLITQFLGDALIFAFLALGLGLLILASFLPYFNRLSGIEFTYSDIFNSNILFTLLVATITVGLLAGSYPAIFLSRFKPVATLKKSPATGVQGGALRKVLVVGQFAISIVLIIFTFMVFQQLHFMKNQNLGFEPEQKLIIPMRGGINLEENYETIKHEFLKHQYINGAAVSSYVIGGSFDTQYIFLVDAKDNKRQVLNHLYIDTDFLPLYKIEMAAGRYFQQDMSTDPDEAIIINETAARALGFHSSQDAIGRLVESGPDGNVRTIIGVTKDFHYKGLTKEINPIIIKILPRRFHYLTLSLKTGDLRNTMKFIYQKLSGLFPDNPLEPFFLDSFFNQQYQKEEQIGRLFSTFSALGLFIACLGLFGLASFMAERKTKEIGIRKVLDASISGIFYLLSKEFCKWVLLANIIAWPVAYFSMSKWLQNFAYRTNIEIWTFIFAMIVAFAVALVTVSYQSIKAALTNPVESLRYE